MIVLPRLLALAALLLLLVPSAAVAATCPRAALGDLEDEVMCTVCGTTLGLATEAPQAQRQREFIMTRVERCESKDEIKAALVGEFGPGVLAVPDNEGFDLAAYLVPALVLLLAGTAVGLAALRWRNARGPHRDRPAPSMPAPSAAASRRLDADLERYEP